MLQYFQPVKKSNTNKQQKTHTHTVIKEQSRWAGGDAAKSMGKLKEEPRGNMQSCVSKQQPSLLHLSKIREVQFIKLMLLIKDLHDSSLPGRHSLVR